MNDSVVKSSHEVWRRRCFVVLFLWLLTTVLLANTAVRAVISYPLFVHQADATGEVAYVMAGGGDPYRERLRAAADLYHMKQVERILILAESQSAGYNFVKGKTDTRLERATDYLQKMEGVPESVIQSVPESENAWFGSLSEARGVARYHPDLESIVVVTSAPHTRRSGFCFRRSFPGQTKIQVYAASPPIASEEINSPIWVEYAKFLVYFFVA